MTNTLTLQDMVNAVISQAASEGKAKIAQEVSERVCEQCGKPAMAGSKICKDCAEKAAKKEEADREGSEGGSEKTSSARIEKLANAVQYLVQNFDDVLMPEGTEKVGQVASQATDNVGAGKGPNVVPTNVDAPVGGDQGTVAGEAKKDTIPSSPPMDSGATPKAAPNAMQTNIDTMKPAYPETGVIKQARARLREIKMSKLAESIDDGAAKINTPKTQTTSLPEDQPSKMERPAQVKSQEKMVGSNEAAINYQKTQAKAAPKKSIGDVLDEKPQDVKQVLKPVLGDVVKEAQQQQAETGRALLQKIAHEGCTCKGDSSENGDCRFCKVASRLKKAQGMRKKSQADAAGMSANPLGPGGVPSTVQSSSNIGGSGSGTTPPMM